MSNIKPAGGGKRVKQYTSYLEGIGAKGYRLCVQFGAKSLVEILDAERKRLGGLSASDTVMLQLVLQSIVSGYPAITRLRISECRAYVFGSTPPKVRGNVLHLAPLTRRFMVEKGQVRPWRRVRRKNALCTFREVVVFPRTR